MLHDAVLLADLLIRRVEDNFPGAAFDKDVQPALRWLISEMPRCTTKCVLCAFWSD